VPQPIEIQAYVRGIEAATQIVATQKITVMKLKCDFEIRAIASGVMRRANRHAAAERIERRQRAEG